MLVFEISWFDPFGLISLCDEPVYRTPAFLFLLASSQDRRHDPRTAVSVHYGNDIEWLPVGRIRDQVIAYADKANRPASEVRTAVALKGNAASFPIAS
jgi:hypothetical protein